MKDTTKSEMNSMRGFKVYKASAGTGKTFTLIAEYLSQCLRAPKSAYKSILATTFTNKATKELKNKLFEHVLNIIGQNKEGIALTDSICRISGLSKDEVIENSKVLFTQILHDYSNINILTIDGFVQRISRAFASDLGLSFDYNVMINTDEAAEDIVEMFSDQLTANSYPAKLAESWVDHNIDEGQRWNFVSSLTDYVKNMLGNRDKRLAVANDLDDIQKLKECESYLSTWIDKSKKSIDEMAVKMIGLCNKFIDDNGLDCNKDLNSNYIKSIINKLGNRETDCNKFYTKSIREFKEDHTKCFKKNFKGNKNIAKDFSNNLFKALEEYFSIVERKTFLDIVREQLYGLALKDHISQLIDQYESETGNIPISEFNKRVADLLGDFSAPFIYEHIGEHFKNYFIDEFQDTSILQWHNFLPLVDNGLSSNGITFVVGDAKQAIYRFRGGEVEQIIQLPKIYGKDESNPIMTEYENNLKRQHVEENLKVCYRSARNIIRFNNSFFKCASDCLSDRYKSVYENLEQKPFKEADGFVRIEMLEKNETISEDDAYCMRCLELIRQLHDEQNYSYKDIAILTRNNDKGIVAAQYLKDNGIPIMSSETLLLRNSNEVRLIINLLKYIQDPSNPIRIANLLYSRLFDDGKCDLAELGRLVRQVKDGGRIEDLLGIETDLMSNFSTTCNTYDLCESLIRILNLDATGNEYIRFLLEDIHNFQSSSGSSVSDYLEHWDKHSDKELLIKTPDNADAVRIMSIHKSKGLEFKVVIYPFASTGLELKMERETYTVSRPNPDSNFEHITDEVINGIPHIANFDIQLTKNFSHGQLKDAYSDIEDKRKLDELNVLYVALTRPKDRLYIITKKDDNSLYSKYITNTYLEFEKAEITRDCDGTSYTLGHEFISEQRNKEQAIQLKAVNSKTIDWFSKMNFVPREVYHNEAERWGVLVHEILSKVKVASDINPIAESYAAAGKLTHEQSANLIEKFNLVVADERISESFGENAVVRSEMDFIDNQGKHIRPDRFVELADRIIIIDYKTGAKDSRHHKQLKEYASALSLLSRKRIECYLLYIGTNLELEEVEIQ